MNLLLPLFNSLSDSLTVPVFETPRTSFTIETLTYSEREKKKVIFFFFNDFCLIEHFNLRLFFFIRPKCSASMDYYCCFFLITLKSLLKFIAKEANNVRERRSNEKRQQRNNATRKKEKLFYSHLLLFILKYDFK